MGENSDHSRKLIILQEVRGYLQEQGVSVNWMGTGLNNVKKMRDV